MGSSCSILNDTDFDAWINHGVNWTVLTTTVGGVAGLVTGGIGALALGAGAGLVAGGVGRAYIKEDKGISQQVTEFKNASKLIKPGEKYTVKATLSLTLKY